jgi:two-component system nitrate/nitrite response regulator NarL
MPLRILLVEDYAPFRRRIAAALQQSDYETIEAADGLEGVQKAEELQPDVILLDINLPKIHGFEVARQVRRLSPHARLLFMSQESSPEIVRQALSLGARGYIEKISAAADLLPAIEAALAGQRFVSQSVAFTEPANAPATRRHEILFCSDDAAIVDGFARYVGAALKASDAALILVTDPHRTHLLRELRAQAVDIDGAMARGTCLSLDADVAPDSARFVEAIDAVRAAAAAAGKAHPRVAFCGERAGRLWAAGRTAEAVQLEEFCGELADDVDILCVYPVPFDQDDRALARICAEHTAVSR